MLKFPTVLILKFNFPLPFDKSLEPESESRITSIVASLLNSKSKLTFKPFLL